MSPRDLDPDVVITRLRLIDDLITIMRGVGPLDRESLERDAITRLAIERALTQMVEMAVDVLNHLLVVSTGKTTRSYREAFVVAGREGILSRDLAASLDAAAGMRNILVHEYVDIDVGKVADVTPLAPAAFSEFIHEVSVWVQAR
ncbi:DUF86 domain-containing protein [soil metagenome]